MITKSLVEYFVSKSASTETGVKETPCMRQLWRRVHLTAQCIAAAQLPGFGLDKLKESFLKAGSPELLVPSSTVLGTEVVIEADGITIDGLKRQLADEGTFISERGLALCFHTDDGMHTYVTQGGEPIVDVAQFGEPVLTSPWYRITNKYVIINFYDDSEVIRLLMELNVPFRHVECSMVKPDLKETKPKSKK